MRRIFIVILLCCTISANAQRDQNLDYYRFPIDMPMLLSANFGEFRSNHFHSGIDIKTGGTEGHNVLATALGYVSRIVINPSGFGRAIYVSHPNGTTSVYGHLKSFTPQIEQYATQIRYASKSHNADLFLSADKFPVDRGDVIGISGNSGISFGPHLHFEIRETASQRTINLLSRGVFKVADNIPPTIVKLYYIEVDTVSGVPIHSAARHIAVKKVAPNAYTLLDTAAQVVGRCGYFAVETTDRKDNTSNTMGVYRVTQMIDGERCFEFNIDNFLFSNTRFVNALSVYSLQRNSRNQIVRLALLENNFLPSYYNVRNRGAIVLTDDLRHGVTIDVEDDNHNLARLSFKIRRADTTKPFHNKIPEQGRVIDASRNFVGGDDGFTINIPAKTLYESKFFDHKCDSASVLGAKFTHQIFSNIYTVMDSNVPLNSAVTLAIEANVPENLRSKAAIASLSGSSCSFIGGSWKDGKMVANIRAFGRFCVVVDTIPPLISSSFTSGADLSKSSSISFTINDQFSGISSFNGWIDGQWILFEYDVLRRKIRHTFDSKRITLSKSHTIKLEVTDRCGNIAVYNGKFTK